MKTKNLLLVAALILGFIACHHSPTEIEEQHEIEYDTLTFADTTGIDSTHSYLWDISVVLPKAGQSAALDSIRRQIITLVFSQEDRKTYTINAQEAMDAYIEYTTRHHHDADCQDFMPDFEEMKHLSLLSATDTTLTFSFEEMFFLGGAHPSSMILYWVFDLRTGHLMTDEDLWRNGTEKQVNRLLMKALQRHIDQDPYLTIEDFWTEQLAPNNNFYLSNDTLYYTFNTYEIAAYACGNHTLAIPIKEAQLYMK